MDFTATDSQIVLIVVLVIWEFIWKGFALWRAARNDDHAWFIAILIINSIGLLPIIYILTRTNTQSEEMKLTS